MYLILGVNCFCLVEEALRPVPVPGALYPYIPPTFEFAKEAEKARPPPHVVPVPVPTGFSLTLPYMTSFPQVKALPLPPMTFLIGRVPFAKRG
jgi:hypothetical protein